MEFLEEIKEKFKNNLDISALNYKIYILGNTGALIFGIKDISLMSDNKIILNLKKQKLEINGTNLHIKSYGKGEIFLGGKINKAELL